MKDKFPQTKNPSRKYLRELSRSRREALALAVGCNQKTLYDIGSGRLDGTRTMILKIEQATRGAVKEADFATEAKREIKEDGGRS